MVQRYLHEKWSRDTFRDYYIHEIMLSDSVRVKAYQRAIQKTVMSNNTVLDLGTGTGLKTSQNDTDPLRDAAGETC